MEKVAVYYTSKINKEEFDRLNLLRIDEWCKKNNYEYTLFIDKVKNRNITKNRLEMNKLKEELEKGTFNKVVIRSIRNLSNDSFFISDFITFIEKNNCKLISMDGFTPLHINLYEIFKNIKEEKER